MVPLPYPDRHDKTPLPVTRNTDELPYGKQEHNLPEFIRSEMSLIKCHDKFCWKNLKQNNRGSMLINIYQAGRESIGVR